MRYPALLVRSRNGVELQTERGKIIDFTCGDLFGIAGHPHVRAASHTAMERFGVSSVSAIERGGYTEIHQAAEDAIAKRLVADRALLFPSRSQAIVSVISAGINTKGGPVYIDASVSSPVSDACHLAELSCVRVDLREFFSGGLIPSMPGILVLESVSRIGAHVPNIAKILEKLAVPLIADESFSFGISGLLGLGSFPPPLLNHIPQIRIVSFEASLGVPCCAVLGSKGFVEDLCSASKHRSGEIGVSPIEAASVVSGLELLEQMGARREEMGMRAAAVIASLRDGGVSLSSDLPLPFLSVNFLNSRNAQEFCTGMLSRGFLVDFVGCLTPLSQSCSVRFSLNIAHSQSHIDGFLRSSIELWKRLNVKS